MRKFLIIVCAIASFWSYGQTPLLSITTNKTTSIVFPFAIRHVDRGSKDVFVQQVKEANNILLVKAGVVDFAETNLSVITDDGTVYCFNLLYSDQPMWLIYHISGPHSSIETYTSHLLDNPPFIKNANDHAWDMDVTLLGIYIKDNVQYYHLQFTNSGSIDYDIDLLKFYVRDLNCGKRTAVQEHELIPLHVAGNNKTIKANSFSTIVVALNKYTIPDRKFIAVQVLEKNGGRHLNLKIHNKQLMRSRIIPD